MSAVLLLICGALGLACRLGFALQSDLGRLEIRLAEIQAAIVGEVQTNRLLATDQLEALMNEQQAIVKELRSQARTNEKIEEAMRRMEAGLAELSAGPDQLINPAVETRVQGLIAAAEVNFENRLYKSVIDRTAEALRLDPDSSGARLYHAASLFRENPADTLRYADVKRQLSQVIRREPSNRLALEILGEIAFEEQEWIRAMLIYAQLSAQHQAHRTYRERCIYATRRMMENGRGQDAP